MRTELSAGEAAPQHTYARGPSAEQTRLRLSSVPPEKLEHSPVQLVPFEILVTHVPAPAVEHAEGAAQVPKRVPPSRLLPEREAVRHPRQRHPVRRLVEAAPLADVHAHAPLQQRSVRLDQLPPEPRTIPRLAEVVAERPRRRLERLELILRHPVPGVVAAGLGQVAATPLHALAGLH